MQTGNGNREIQLHRTPPYSEQAEMGVLGSMLCSREATAECVDRVRSEQFYLPTSQTVFGVLCELYEKGIAIDLITFTNELRDRNLLDGVGGAAAVTALLTFVPTAANVGYYIDILRAKHMARTVIARCTECVRVAYDDQNEVEEVLEQTQSALTEIIMDAERPDVFKPVKDGVDEAMEQLCGQRGEAAIHGLATGIIDFDRMTAGLRGGQLVIVGARPSHGKTALAMNFAATIAIKNKIPVAAFSMEMSFQEIVNRLVCSVAGISLQRFRDAFLSRKDFDELPDRVTKIREAPLWIDESPALSIPSFRARARLLRTRYGVRAIVVDYLQLMRSPTKRGQEARWLEITEISQALKATAKELDIPVICCAQLNREAESREFGKPKLSDLRESGSIENDADIVALLWRPARHLQHKGDRKKLAKLLRLKFDDIELWEEEKEMTDKLIKERDEQIEEYAELIIAKHRNGPVGEVRLRFRSDMTLFENVTQKTWSNKEEERQYA